MTVRLGLLRLTDSAPAVLADAQGLFTAEGIDVSLHVEPSWANIADKLYWGKLDAAIMLPPLAVAMAAGLRGPPCRLIVPMGISQGGNTVAVSRAVADAMPASLPAAAGLRTWLRDQRCPPRFAVVHVFSTHNLLLLHWLASAGIDPDRDLEIVVIPPEQVVEELTAGHIAGFCAGAPWGDWAEATGAGRILFGSSAIRPRHAEKCLALAAAWATARRTPYKASCEDCMRRNTCAICRNGPRRWPLCSHIGSNCRRQPHARPWPEAAASSMSPSLPRRDWTRQTRYGS